MLRWVRAYTFLLLVRLLTPQSSYALGDSVSKDSMTPTFLREQDLNGDGRNDSFVIKLQNDNNNMSLPTNYKAWWYVRLSSVDTERAVTIRLKDRGHRHFFRPVFSYDGIDWQLLPAEDIKAADGREMLVRTRFDQDSVFLARAEPYSFAKLNHQLSLWQDQPMVRVTHLARSQRGYPIPMITITDFNVDEAGKSRVWIHARTHPGEVASSFVIEGLVNDLIAGGYNLSTTIFSIVPMHNIDGVIAGNNRTTPQSENLEELWDFDESRPSKIAKESPRENQILAEAISSYQAGKAPIKVMLNLHSTNGHPEFYPHFIPHFGANTTRYDRQQRSLFLKQKRLADLWYRTMNYSADAGQVVSNPLFLKKSYPETWLWRQFQDRILAVTLESTYGMVPSSSRYFNSEEHKKMGQGLAKAVMNFLGL